MFKNRDVASGFLFILIALAFGISTILNYPVGAISNPGPGLLPLVVSSFLLLSGISIWFKGLLAQSEQIVFRIKNLVIVMLSIVVFVIVTKYINMVVGITVLIFASTIAIPNYSVIRNIKIVSGLVLIALLFKYGAGLDLPLV
jgi:hypothetical protein